jgi:hypothetical protein
MVPRKVKVDSTSPVGWNTCGKKGTHEVLLSQKLKKKPATFSAGHSSFVWVHAIEQL